MTVVAVSMAGLALAGCGEQAAGPPATIHVAVPLSGSLGGRGRDMERAVRMAIDESGGVEGDRELRLVVHDAGEEGELGDAARSAVRDSRSVALIGGLSPAATLRASGATGGAEGLLLVSPAGATGLDPKRYGSDSALGRAGDRAVTVAPSEYALGDAIAQAAATAGSERIEWFGDGLPKTVVEGMRAGAHQGGLGIAEAGPGPCPKPGVTRVNAVEAAGEQTAFAAVHCAGASILVADAATGALEPQAWNGRRLMTPALAYDDLPPAGRAFYDAFEEQHGHTPDRWAIFAYEAAGLVLQAIEDAQDGSGQVTRETVRDATFAVENRFGPVGRYDVLPDGRTTLGTFAVRELPLSDRGDKGDTGTEGSGTDRVIEAQD